MNNKNAKITMIIAVLAIIFMVGVGTYAFFAPQTGGSTSTNATVTSNTTDLLTFSINRDISFTVTQANFEENGQNQSGDATATATLTPNNKTGAATMNYYLYLNIENNDLVYTTEEPGYYVNTELLVPFSDTTDPDYEEKYFFSNEYVYLLSQYTGKISVDEIAPLMRELFEGIDAEMMEKGVYDFINQDIIKYKDTNLPLEVLTDEETGDSYVSVGQFDESDINYLVSLGWFRKVGNPELVLQVFDNNNDLVELEDMMAITTKGVTGYDITTKNGLIPLLNNHAISASNNQATIENWRVVITLINLDVNQNDNTGKIVEARLVIKKEDPITYVYWTDGFSGTSYTKNQIPTGTGLNGVYSTSDEIASIYDDYAYSPIFVRTTMIDDVVLEHKICGRYYNGKDFCLGNEYSVENETPLVERMQTDIENQLGIELNNGIMECYNSGITPQCVFSGFNCSVLFGKISCSSPVSPFIGCSLTEDGTAMCDE